MNGDLSTSCNLSNCDCDKPKPMTDQRARVLASDMMTATSLVSKINNQRNRIAGGYDIPTNEPGPINIVAQALADERQRVWEEAANVAEQAIPKAHTYASENADIYRAQDDAKLIIVKAIRAKSHAGQEG